MLVALRTGQPYSDVLTWDPRDVDTAMRILFDDQDREQQAEQDRAREARFAAGTQEVFERMRAGR